MAFRGHYADGRTATLRPVHVSLGAHGLEFADEHGLAIVRWPYRELRLIETVYAGQPVRLRARSGGEARLIVGEPGFLDALARHARHLGSGNLQRSRSLPRALAWTAATIGTLIAIYFGLPLLAEPIAALVPLAWEERLGRSVRGQALAMFARNTQLCVSPPGHQALARLAGKLGGTIESGYTFRLDVVDSPVVNAFAAPAGYMVIFRGLIDKAESAEEVAGVLAHEMGHVIERHGTEALIRHVGLQLILTAAVGDASGLASTAAQLATLSYGRDAEREADRVGVAMLNRTNIAGAGLANFFRRLGKQDGIGDRGLFRYLASHPPSAERARDVEQRVVGTGPAMTAEEWRALRAICAVKRSGSTD